MVEMESKSISRSFDSQRAHTIFTKLKIALLSKNNSLKNYFNTNKIFKTLPGAGK